MPVVVGHTGRQERNFKVALLVALGKTRSQIQAMQPVGNSTFSGLLKDDHFQELVTWIKAHFPETTEETTQVKPPTPSESLSPTDPKQAAHGALVALLGSGNETIRLRAAEILLRTEPPVRETNLSDFDHLFPGDIQ